MLEKLDAICERYGVDRKEALRLAIIMATRYRAPIAKADGVDLLQSLDALRVANEDMQRNIVKVAKALVQT